MDKRITHVGNSWFLLDKAYALNVMSCIRGEPGVKIAKIGVDDYRVQLHYTHLPLLPDFQELPNVVGNPPSVFNDYQDPPDTWFQELWDHQVATADILASRHGNLCALDLGGGKSRTAIAGGLSPYLIVCPKTASSVWEDELDYVGLRYRVLEGKSPKTFNEVKAFFEEQGRQDAWVLNYHVAKYWLPYFCHDGAAPRVHTVIMDEAHALQKKHLEWYTALSRVRHEQMIQLTATPIRNRLRSLWALLNMLAPGAWGKLWEFRKVYCAATMSEYGLVDGIPDDKTVERLQKRLSAVLVKLTRKQIGQILPSITREVWEPPIPREEIAQVIMEAAEGVHAKDIKAGSHLAWRTSTRRALGLLKVPFVVEKTLNLLTKWRKAVLWVWHDDVATGLKQGFAKVGIDVDILLGRTSQRVRDRISREWKSGDPLPSRPRVLVASIGAASSAVSFTTAGLSIFVEQDWAPLQIQQAEARTHRYGQKHNECYSLYVVIPGTIDEEVGRALVDKSTEAERILGEDGQVAQMKTLLGEYEESINDFMIRRAHEIAREV